MFFFEKKNQKTSAYDFVSAGGIASCARPTSLDRSVFASFSSEKEKSGFLHFSKMHNTLYNGDVARTI